MIRAAADRRFRAGAVDVCHDIDHPLKAVTAVGADDIRSRFQHRYRRVYRRVYRRDPHHRAILALNGTEDFESLERAEAQAVQVAEHEVHRQVRSAGAEECQVTLDHHRRTSEVMSGELLIELEIRAVAIGRPRIASA